MLEAAETDNQTQHGHKVLNVMILFFNFFFFYLNFCDAAPQIGLNEEN